MDFQQGGHQSRQKERGRKHVRCEKAAAYKRIKVLEAELENCKKKAERLKTRLFAMVSHITSYLNTE